MASTVDDYESGAVGDRYSGNTADYAFVAGSNTDSGAAASGSQVLELSSTDSNWYNIRGGAGAQFDTGLNDEPEPGDTFEFYLQTAGNQGKGVVCWGVQENAWVADGGYALRWSWGGPSLDFQAMPTDGTNFTTLASFSAPDRPADVWYRYEVQWAEDYTFTITVYNEDGDQIEQITHQDTTYQFGKGGVAYEMNSGISQWADGYVITTEAGGAAQTIDAGVGTLTLQGPAGDIAGTGTATVSAGIGTTALDGPAGAITASGTATIDAGIGTTTLQGPAGDIQLGGQTIDAGVGTLTLQGPAGDIAGTGTATITAGTGAIPLTGPAGAVTASGVATVDAGVGTVTLVGPAGELGFVTTFRAIITLDADHDTDIALDADHDPAIDLAADHDPDVSLDANVDSS